MTGAAVIIGVSETSGLETLDGVATGVEGMSTWAQSQGYEVAAITDLPDPVTQKRATVTSERLRASTEALAKRRDLDKVLIYFAGHGFSTEAEEDYWYLSAGPADVIDFSSSIILARNTTRLRHVVFITDACRTTPPPDHLYAPVGAVPLFKPRAASDKKAIVDVFSATMPGRPALERKATVSDEQFRKAHGIFTDVLLAALGGEVPDLISIHPSDGRRVLFAAFVKPWLKQEVGRRSSQAASFTQNPDIRHDSHSDVWLAAFGDPQKATLTARASLAADNGPPADAAAIEIRSFAGTAMAGKRVAHGPGPELSAVLPHGIYGFEATQPGYVQAPAAPNPLHRLTSDHTQPVVLRPEGAPVFSAQAPAEPPAILEQYVIDELGQEHPTPPSAGVYEVVNRDLLTGRGATDLQALEPHESPRTLTPLAADREAEDLFFQAADRPGRVAFETATGLSITGTPFAEPSGRHQGFDDDGLYWYVRGDEPASIAIPIGEGNYAAVAMFPGFIGDLHIEANQVESLRYRPAPGSAHYGEFPDEEMRRMLVIGEAFARSGAHHVVDKNAVAIGGDLRRLKHANPMLGVYAAYAYAEVGNVEQIRDMIRFYEDQGQTVPFDVVVLAERDPSHIGVPVAPAFPLLTRGWMLLGPDDEIPAALAAARKSLLPTMYTTITGKGGDSLASALHLGDIR